MPPGGFRYDPGADAGGLIELTPEEEAAILAAQSVSPAPPPPDPAAAPAPAGPPPQPTYVATDTNAGSAPPPPPPDPAVAPGPPPQPAYAATDANGGYAPAPYSSPSPQIQADQNLGNPMAPQFVPPSEYYDKGMGGGSAYQGGGPQARDWQRPEYDAQTRPTGQRFVEELGQSREGSQEPARDYGPVRRPDGTFEPPPAPVVQRNRLSPDQQRASVSMAPRQGQINTWIDVKDSLESLESGQQQVSEKTTVEKAKRLPGNAIGTVAAAHKASQDQARTDALNKQQDENFANWAKTQQMLLVDKNDPMGPGYLSGGRNIRFLENNITNLPLVNTDNRDSRAAPLPVLNEEVYGNLPREKEFIGPVGMYREQPKGFNSATAELTDYPGLYVDANGFYGMQVIRGNWVDVTEDIKGRTQPVVSAGPFSFGEQELPQRLARGGEVYEAQPGSPTVGVYDATRPDLGALVDINGVIYKVDGRGSSGNYIRRGNGEPAFEWDPETGDIYPVRMDAAGTTIVERLPNPVPGVNLNDLLTPIYPNASLRAGDYPARNGTTPAQTTPATNSPGIVEQAKSIGSGAVDAGKGMIGQGIERAGDGLGQVGGEINRRTGGRYDEAVNWTGERIRSGIDMAGGAVEAGADAVAPLLPGNDGSAEARIAAEFLASAGGWGRSLGNRGVPDMGSMITGAVPGYRPTVGEAPVRDTRNRVEQIIDDGRQLIGMDEQPVGMPPTIVDPAAKRAAMADGRTVGSLPPGMPDMGAMTTGGVPPVPPGPPSQPRYAVTDTNAGVGVPAPTMPDTQIAPGEEDPNAQRSFVWQRGGPIAGPDMRGRGAEEVAAEAPPEVKDPVPVAPAIASGDGANAGDTGSGGGSSRKKSSSGGSSSGGSSSGGSSRSSRGGSSGGSSRGSSGGGGSGGGRTMTFRSSDGRTWTYDTGFDTWTRDDGKMVLGMRSRRMGRKGRRGRRGMGMPMPSPMGNSVFANPIFDQYRDLAGDWMPQVYTDGMVGGTPVSSPGFANVPEGRTKRRAGRRDKE